MSSNSSSAYDDVKLYIFKDVTSGNDIEVL
jgi:hypothetical protein